MKGSSYLFQKNSNNKTHLIKAPYALPMIQRSGGKLLSGALKVQFYFKQKNYSNTEREGIMKHSLQILFMQLTFIHFSFCLIRGQNNEKTDEEI